MFRIVDNFGAKEFRSRKQVKSCSRPVRYTPEALRRQTNRLMRRDEDLVCSAANYCFIDNLDSRFVGRKPVPYRAWMCGELFVDSFQAWMF